MERVIDFLIAIEIPISTKPTGLRWPAQVQTWCGWVFNTIEGTVLVTAEKCAKARGLVQAVLLADDQRRLMARMAPTVRNLCLESRPPARMHACLILFVDWFLKCFGVGALVPCYLTKT